MSNPINPLDFEIGFDSFTRSIAREVNNFFYNADLSHFNNDSELANALLKHFLDHFPIQLNELQVNVKKNESGIIGCISSKSMPKPLYFEGSKPGVPLL